MSDPLKIGDRVRLAVRIRHPPHRAGETGTVVAVLALHATSGSPLVQVRLDGDPATSPANFYEDELELV